jgi:hypothetical protein
MKSTRTVRTCLAAAAALGVWLTLAPTPARAFPAFARRTGLRCTACHELWPVFNDTGRAFRDNGYQMRLGKDNPTENPFSYWPVAVRITPHYEYNTASNQETDQGKKSIETGGIADGAMDLLIGGNLNENVSYLVVPTGFASDGVVNLESYFVYFTRLFGTDWFNLRLGKHEVDLPVSAHRGINLTNGYLVYGYHPMADGEVAGVFALDENQRGVEVLGHDRGSMMRYSVSIFNSNDSPGSDGVWDSPGYYAHFQKYWQLDSTTVSEVEVGAFDSSARYPTSSLTLGGDPIGGTGRDLKATDRYGVELSALFGPATTPVHVTAVWAEGKDDKDLYLGAASRDGKWNGGFLQAIWVPPTDGLHWGIFGRYDWIRNTDQPIDGFAKDYNDQDQYTLGMKYTFAFLNRDEYALHIEYSSDTMKHAAFDGSDLRVSTMFAGIDFAF